jgi:glucose/mannose-6-phosphate isomerase
MKNSFDPFYIGSLLEFKINATRQLCGKLFIDSNDFHLMDEMLTLEKISRIDRANMLGHLMRFPEMCEETLSKKVELPGLKPANIVIAGMGGSAAAGDLLRDWLSLPVPLEVCKGYELPAWVDERSLVIAVSYSGSTEETLSCFSGAIKRNAGLVAITSGGKLEEMCKASSKPCIKIPPGLPPRAALPYLFSSLVQAFKELGLARGKEEEVSEAIKLLKTMREEMAPAGEGNQAERIARGLVGTTPVIYAPIGLRGAALRLKNQLNENSKVFGKMEILPELCHNEIVGLSSAPKNLSFIFLRDIEESGRIRMRIKFMEELLSERKPTTLRARGKGGLARILSLVYTGDFISFYLAILRGVDPTPVPEITQLKDVLSR